MAVPAPVRSGFRVSGPDEVPVVYDHPPLVEAWLVVNFQEGGESLAKNATALRERLGPEWSERWREAPHLASPAGLQLTNVMGDRALRLNQHGFAFGWLGHGGERYPRYESVRDGFVAVLDAVRSLDADTVQVPRHWEVRYVNRIPQGTVWSTPDDWSFFSLWNVQSMKSLGIDPVGAQAQWQLPLDCERGTLIVEFRHQQDSVETGDCVWINLHVSGAVEEGESGLFDGFDFGREVIVRSFNELVSPVAKSYWGVASRPR